MRIDCSQGGYRAKATPLLCYGNPRKQFFFYYVLCYSPPMFRSIPFEPRELRASDEVLEAIYQAAKLGIKGDALAFAAGLLPIEYRRLQALDTRASIAEAKGRADSEVEMATAVRAAALDGDTKAGLALLSVLHEWVPKQQINVDIKSQISITEALREAERRVIEGRVLSDEELALEPMRLPSYDASINRLTSE